MSMLLGGSLTAQIESSKMSRRFNDRSQVRTLAIIVLVPFITLARSYPNPESPTQTKQQRKAEARRRAGGGTQKEALAEPGAPSPSRLALPCKRAWQYLTDEASTLAPSIDDARIYLALAGGRVVCLDRETGALHWSSEPGGIISAPVAVGDNWVFIATRKIADDGSEAGGSLRAVDK